MSTDPASVRRLAVVLARHHAATAAAPGLDPQGFAAACLADSYEAVADLAGVTSGVAGGPEVTDLLWPGALRFDADATLIDIGRLVAGDFDVLVVVAADVPDLPGMVLAKLFRMLHRQSAGAVVDRRGPGWVAVGTTLPAAPWLADLDLDDRSSARGHRLLRAAEWHRLRTVADLSSLDPGLEGWEATRACLRAGSVGWSAQG